jgi:hypothetical protein
MYRSAAAFAAMIALAAAPRPLMAQKYPGPTQVTATASGNSVTVSWVAVKGKAMYRVTRALDAKNPGKDITPPIASTSFVDQGMTMGATNYYQVIAVYPDGTTGAAAPVGVTLPAPATMSPVKPLSGGLATIQDPRSSALATRYTPSPAPPPPPAPPAPPPVLTGITVTGTTTASAVVSWPAVPGATSYTVARTLPSGSTPPMAYPGLAGPTWTDLGPSNLGFFLGGTYQYQVTALLGDGTTVSGTASWTRPSPSCAPPSPTQPMLAVLNPLTNSQFTAQGPYPDGAVYTWTGNANQVIAYIVERSVQGSSAWTLVGTSCTGNPSRNTYGGGSAGAAGAIFVDNIGGIVPNTTYLYRFTGLAANGQAGSGTLTWTAPNPGILRWIAITPGPTSVTVQWRYEQPIGAVPAAPFHGFGLTYGNGLTQSQNYSSGACSAYVGCSMTVSNPPKGSQPFRIAAKWIHTVATNQGNVPMTMGTVTADTVVVIP